MKEKPIIFSAESVRGILAGTKTQTRRVIKPQPDPTADKEWANYLLDSPYPVGTRLWVKETWLPWDASGGIEKYIYRATEQGTAYVGSWKSPLFMPRHAGRITLEVLAVKVERLQEISEEDAKAEGVTDGHDFGDGSARTAFAMLWDSINAKRGHAWDKNDWVFAYTFRRIRP